MLKEIMTCDSCDKPVKNRRYLAIEVSVVKPRRGGLYSPRRRRQRGSHIFVDLCATYFAKVVKAEPALNPIRSKRCAV